MEARASRPTPTTPSGRVAATYAGLRRGELRALRWSDVDFDAGQVRASRTWDNEQGEQDDGKSDAAERSFPIIGELRTELASHKLATGHRGDDLVFGPRAARPFEPTTVRRRALAAWKTAALEPIGLNPTP